MSDIDFGLRDNLPKKAKTKHLPKVQKLDAFSYTTWMSVCSALGSAIGLILLIIGSAMLFVDRDPSAWLLLIGIGAGTLSVGVLQGTLVEISRSLNFLALKADQESSR